MKPVFVHKENIELYENLRPMVEKVVNRACHGEFNADDIKKYIKKGSAFGAYAVDDNGEVEIGVVWEMVYYLSGLTCVNVMCVGGRRSSENWKEFGVLLEKLWKDQGATHVECFTSPAMLKIINRAGFKAKPMYVFSRGKL